MLPQDYTSNAVENNPDVKLRGIQYERNPGAEFGEHIRNTTARCNTSASHTYGNVLAVVEKFLLDQFPPNTFRTVTASTTLASRQIKHLPHQLHKQECPIMVLIPRISFGQGDDRFLANTLINSRYTNTHALWGDGSLLQLAHDRKKNIYIHGHYNRALMFIDVVMSFNTYAEQINWMSYMHNMFPIEHNQFIRSPLELYIPNQFCEIISGTSGIPIKNENNSVYDFLTFMNGMFDYPITYKIKGGSNTDEFFMYYIADIDTVIREPEAGAGVKDGQVHRNFDISFTIRCEFNTIGYFTLNSPAIKKDVVINAPDTTSITPIFSDVINLDDFDLPQGWSVLSWPIFKLSPGEDSVSIDNVLNQSLLTVIDHHLRLGMPMDNFIKIQFRENGQILNNEGYRIDWAARRLYITNPNSRRTYRLIITVSANYINNMIKDIYNLE